MAMRANPGKFDNALDEAVWTLSLDGGADREVGSSSEAPGTWAGLIRFGKGIEDAIKEDRSAYPNVSDADLKFLGTKGEAGVILTESSDGTVKVKYYEERADLDRDWAELEDELGGDEGDEDDDDGDDAVEAEFEPEGEPSAEHGGLALADPVTVGPAFRMGGTREPDEWSGAKLYVVELPAGGDVGLARHPEDDVIVWIHHGRLKKGEQTPNRRRGHRANASKKEHRLADGTRVTVYDNGGETRDRYSVVLRGGEWDSMRRGDMLPILGMTASGGSEFTEGQAGRHLGWLVAWSSLPETVRRNIEARVRTDQQKNSGHRPNSSIADRRARGEIEGLTRAEIDSMEIRIPDWNGEWRQISGDINPGAHGGVIATADGQAIEVIEIQPVRESQSDDEAKEVGFPFWTKEGYYDLDDLSLSDKGVQSAIEFTGLGEHLLDMTPEQRAMAIAEACVSAGHRTDEGPGGFSKDILGGRQVHWASGEVAGNEYLSDEDDEFRREVLGEEDEDEDEFEPNSTQRSELEKEGTLDQLLEMQAETNDGSGRGYVPREVKDELEIPPNLSAIVLRYERDLYRALEEVVAMYPPNDGASAQELFNDNAPYLVLMTLRGEGVGIWDGDWDSHYDSNQIKKVGDYLKGQLRRYADDSGSGAIHNAMDDAVFDAATRAGYTATDSGYQPMKGKNRPKAGSHTRNSSSVRWHVFLNGELVRTIYMPPGLSAGAVKRELIAEGYDPNIIVDQPPDRRSNLPPHYRASTTMHANRPWSRHYINALPDSAFLYVGPDGGRHFPFKDKAGNVDLRHLRNALARIPQSNVPARAKQDATTRGRLLLAQHGGYR